MQIIPLAELVKPSQKIDIILPPAGVAPAACMSNIKIPDPYSLTSHSANPKVTSLRKFYGT
jgi:hypothetical protein